MAKKAPVGEEPYRPINENLIRSVLAPSPLASIAPAAKSAKPSPTLERSSAELVGGEELQKVVVLPKRTESQPSATPVAMPTGTRPQRKPRDDEVFLPRKLDREKRMLLTQDEERTIDRFVSELGSEMGAALKLSHVLRACVLLLRNAEEHVLERARLAPRIARPANGDVLALAEFEKQVARVLSAAFRDAAPLK